MIETINNLLKEMENNMQQALQHLEKEFSRIRAGKASPEFFEEIKIEYYGTLTPLNQLASINIPDARTIVIQPWDKSILGSIEKSILAANLGFTPINNGEILRINMPPITEERRKELVKKAKQESENARVAVRNIRRSFLERLKKLEKEGFAEDIIKQAEKNIQETTDNWINKIDKAMQAKEKDIMTI